MEEEGEEDAQMEEGEEKLSGPQWMIRCNEDLATRIHSQIVKVILPQLHTCLTQKVSSAGLSVATSSIITPSPCRARAMMSIRKQVVANLQRMRKSCVCQLQ